MLDRPTTRQPQKNASEKAMYDMPWLWGDDDPHPGLETIKKAHTLTWPTDAYGKQAKPLMPDTANFRIDDPFKGAGMFEVKPQDFTGTAFKTNDGALMPNVSTGSKGMLAGQVGTSLYAGKNAEGQRLTEKYEQLNPYRDQRRMKTNETLLDARKQAEQIISPNLGDAPVKLGFSSAASNRHNQGWEYLPAMQGALQKGRIEGIQDSNETESNFSHRLMSKAANKMGDAYRQHYESAARSIDGAEAPYSKLYPENLQYYEQLPQRLAEPGAKAIRERESLLEVNDEDRRQSTQWQNGARVGSLKKAGIASDSLMLIEQLLPQKEGIVDNPLVLESHIRANNRKKEIRDGRAQMISATQLKGKDPGETWQNLKRWCSETLLGEYAIDLALVVGRGRVAHTVRTMKTLSAVANYADRNQREQDALENARINRQFRFGKDESAAHTRLNEMADRLDQNSSTAVKFLIKIIPDPMRQDFLETYDGVRQSW